MTEYQTLPLNSNSTGDSPEGWRLYWQAESRRVGSDWVSLLAAAQAALTKLRIVHGVTSS